MNAKNPIIVKSLEVDKALISVFLDRFYGKIKGDFLRIYGDWWYRGNDNSLVVLVGDDIAAYCALIPSKCIIQDGVYDFLWWVDLVVAPEFRGMGIQTLIDGELRHTKDLVLGFPNELAIKIHQKHGWGIREDGHVMMFPLMPNKIKRFRSVPGFKGIFLQAVSLLLLPAVKLFTTRLSRFNPHFTYSIESPSPDILAGIFRRHRNKDTVTTCRDGDYFKWRYMDSPYISELIFLMAGKWNSPSHYLIARHKKFGNYRVTRILDIWGDFHSTERLRDLIYLAVKDAVRQGSSQVTVMVWNPALASVLRTCGFILKTKARFCWHSKSSDIMRIIKKSDLDLCLGDSDNDEPG